MVTIAHLTEKIIERKPFMEEALAKGLINYAALAEEIKPELEKELKQKIKSSAIIMALRRFSEKINKGFIKEANLKLKYSDTTIKSELFEISIKKSNYSIDRIRKIYELVEDGDFLTITQGLYEITIIASKKFKIKIQKILETEKTTKTIVDLSALTIRIPPEMVDTRGFFYVVTKALNWEGVNIVEIVSTFTEMTFIIRDAEISKAFNAIRTLVKEKE